MNIEQITRMMDSDGRIGGYLDLRGTSIKALPEGLTVVGRVHR